MKPRKSLILAYSIACTLAIGAGLAFGFTVNPPKVEMTWNELAEIMRDDKLAISRVQKIEVVTEDWPAPPSLPQLEVQFKNQGSHVLVSNPNRLRIEWLLEKATRLGIDFDRVYLIPYAIRDGRREIHLVKDSKKTENYQSPLSEAFFSAQYPEPVKSPIEATPKYSETSSGGISKEGVFWNGNPRSNSQCGFPIQDLKH